jgi:hypothetical protein
LAYGEAGQGDPLVFVHGVKSSGSCKVVRQQTRHCGEMRSQTLVVYSLRVRPT